MVGRVLLIGEDTSDVEMLKKALKKSVTFIARSVRWQGFSPDVLREYKPDVILMDAGDAFPEAIKRYHLIKKEPSSSETPILLLIDGAWLLNDNFELPPNVDDLLTKPVRPEEALTRLSLLHRKRHKVTDRNLIVIGELEMDVSRYEVRVGGQAVDLTYTEYELLKFLASHPGQVFDRDVLLNKVWGYDYFGGARTVDVHVRRLRSKIEIKKNRFIDTIRNIGYKFIQIEGPKRSKK